ncbi:ABC transporter substrate-binding protein [Gynurincola endophyticus]|uniref:ABC transporter substrate-binding protein n=1 Tax=Gynurincola endophyticus TaxID=2479004 RepID=UPI000F8D1E61|nr:ABC transporter substrate-binding protein [Gynurincola endophyticus]
MFRLTVILLVLFITVVSVKSAGILSASFWKKEQVEKKRVLEKINVGHLPVTCHLTCPVTDYTSKTTTTEYEFVSKRFFDFPTIANAIQSKDLMATMMVAPLAFKLKQDGVPIRICYLGHRDGSQVIVKKNSNYKSIDDLVGKNIAVPSLYSNQHFVLYALLKEKGYDVSDVNFIPLPPPEMPMALASGAIDAFFVGEPFPAKAEMEDVGRVLYLSSEIWPDFISCVLVVHEDLIKNKPDAVKELVRGIAESGAWLEENREQAANLAAEYYNQDVNLLKYILMAKSPQRVSYINLQPSYAEFTRINQIGVEIGLLDRMQNINELVDLSFIPNVVSPAKIEYKKQ